jgi:uncharacterized protein YqfA (UPF0365 family)
MNFIGIFLVLIGLAVLGFIVSFMHFAGIWIRALVSGVKVDLNRLIMMKLRRIPPGLIVDVYIKSTQAGLGVTLDQLEKHYLAGGHVANVTDAMTKARHRDIMVSFEVVAKNDLAGFDLETMDPNEFELTPGVETTEPPPIWPLGKS